MEVEYLRGVLAPVEDELELRNLKVRGEIPSGLRGTYLRNGPNPAFPPAGPYHLWDASTGSIFGCAVMPPASPWLIIDYANEAAPEGVDANAYLCEFRIDLAAGSVTRERIGELPGEFCKVPDAVAGRKNRYGYLASFSTGIEEGAFFDSITKYDLVSGRQVTRGFGRGKVVGEPAFAPDPKGGAEDDGWLVFYLHERDGSASEFLVLDARDVTAEPVARIPMPRRVPLGFHGNWMTPE